jgi:hypothetical protein
MAVVGTERGRWRMLCAGRHQSAYCNRLCVSLSGLERPYYGDVAAGQLLVIVTPEFINPQ